ncbi:MAG: hypothetical protein JRI68_10510 [Deltaproteobacteria bacterium]|nr:hypothetical protein [Deltaproteobacteria bacterium]
MKSELTKVLGCAAVASVLAAACTTVDTTEQEEELAITQQSTVSQCGGFDPQVVEYDQPDSGELGYCDAEVLHWSYEASSQQLIIVDSRMELNCCGEHSSTIVKDGDTYVVTQVDAPEGGMGRCDCECVFDFELQAEGIPAETIQLQVLRDVTDNGAGPQLVFEGSFDLTQVAGEEVIDPNPSDWCYDDEAPSAS